MNDLIKRSDAIGALNGWLKLNHFPEFGDGILYLVPSADIPQGEWIDAEIPLESGGSMPIQVCNLCKTFYPLAYTGGGHRFCPNCGCRMRKEKE